ncbi:MAG: PQQ-like beta-propeller repeat protein [Candidatus Riflebacteria bacterium]|nr:PQQ-like beta-propeller repeat protein [Candidatus Riflebacteria bacterium]
MNNGNVNYGSVDLPDEFQKLWTCKAPSEISSDPLIVGDRIWILAHDGSFMDSILVCIYRKSGKIIWQKEIRGIATPGLCLSSGSIIVTLIDGTICSFDSDTGVEKWQKKLDNFKILHPGLLFDENIAIAISRPPDEPHILLLDSNTGSEKFSFSCPKLGFFGNTWQMPVQTGNLIILVYGTNVIAVNFESGREEWHHSTEGSLQAGPAIHSDSVFFGSGYELYQFEVKTGIQKNVFRFSEGPKRKICVPLSIAITENRVFGGVLPGNLYAFSLSDAKLLSSCVISGGYAVASNSIWLSTGYWSDAEPGSYSKKWNYELQEIDANSFKKKTRNITGVFENPVFSEGQMFLRYGNSISAFGRA